METGTYFVHYWSREPGRAWNLERWQLSEVNSVDEALQWATNRASGRQWQLLALNPWSPEEKLLVLRGEDPNE